MSGKGLFTALADFLDQAALIAEEVTGEPQKGMRRKAKACRKVVTAAEDAQQVAVKAQKIAAAIKPAATKIVEEMKDLPVRIKAYKQ